jgi:hypothetical protein
MITCGDDEYENEVIWGYVSPDGFEWEAVSERPLLDGRFGKFDQQNILLWDDDYKRYVIYCRGRLRGKRVIKRTESVDFRSFTEPELILAPDEKDPPALHLYTEPVEKYFRASHAYVMYPMVLYEPSGFRTGRQYPGAPYPGLSDTQFCFSRDGIHWDRRFRQPALPHGPDERNWRDREPLVGQGLIQTSPTELSIYYAAWGRSPESHTRRATIRLDGFISVEGPYVGWGEFTTRPLLFEGRQLELNYQTSGGGTILVELQTESGQPLKGNRLEDCREIFGDRIEGIVSWNNGSDVSALAGKAIRLRVRFRDAHLYAFRFVP